MPEISNPNLQSQGPGGGGGGGDMRSTLLFTMLILAVLLGYQYFMKPSPQQTQQNQTQNQAQNSQQSHTTAQTPAPAQVTAVPGQSVTAAPAVQAALETQTTVENPVFKIVFTNRGAQVKHWILKAYKDSDGKPLDMVQPQVAAKVGYPLSLFTYEPALTDQLNQALYQVTAEGAQPTATGEVQAPTVLIFHYQANGLDVVKTFRFDKSYVVGVETQVLRNGWPVRALVEWPGGLGDMEEFLPSSANRSPVRTSASSMFAWSQNGKQDSLAAHKVSGYATLNEAYSYAAIADLYFAAAFLPESPEQTTVVTLHNTIDLPSDLSDANSKKTPADVIGLAVGDQSGTTKLRLFAGPKATELLSSIHAIGADGKQTGQSLDPLIQLGWLTVIAKPLYLVLRFFYEHGVPNWGWAIIIVTVLFNLALLYTRISMMKSSLKMMRIQPKVEAIKKRYAHLKMNDPKRAEMNQETMALYKTEGVNMYGSCLPMLLQMPLFFAYYKVLANAVELRQAQWYWLKDLSSPDPLYILPILIIGSMFLVQILTPSPGMDPAQRKMMAFLMPVIFGFSMLHFASGLALYWATGNLIMLALQLAINKSSIGREMHELAARRAAKKTGSAKTIQGRR
ncbi:MAG: membrane protein insertase YidC [Terracidiphilus sp.]|nr:membrane protein insertase YidC [Terracidiphilus sp.]